VSPTRTLQADLPHRTWARGARHRTSCLPYSTDLAKHSRYPDKQRGIRSQHEVAAKWADVQRHQLGAWRRTPPRSFVETQQEYHICSPTTLRWGVKVVKREQEPQNTAERLRKTPAIELQSPDQISREKRVTAAALAVSSRPRVHSGGHPGMHNCSTTTLPCPGWQQEQNPCRGLPQLATENHAIALSLLPPPGGTGRKIRRKKATTHGLG